MSANLYLQVYLARQSAPTLSASLGEKLRLPKMDCNSQLMEI